MAVADASIAAWHSLDSLQSLHNAILNEQLSSGDQDVHRPVRHSARMTLQLLYCTETAASERAEEA